MADNKKTSTLESYLSEQHFKGEMSFTSNLYEELSEDIKDDISWHMSNCLKQIQDEILEQWTKTHKQEEREEHISCLTKLFEDVGFEPCYVKVIDNQYCNDPFYFTRPWLLVTTRKGVIEIGWRKRVISLDWSMSEIESTSKKLFENEEVTKGDKSIHCWGEEKAIEYLTILKNSK